MNRKTTMKTVLHCTVCGREFVGNLIESTDERGRILCNACDTRVKPFNDEITLNQEGHDEYAAWIVRDGHGILMGMWWDGDINDVQGAQRWATRMLASGDIRVLEWVQQETTSELEYPRWIARRK